MRKVAIIVSRYAHTGGLEKYARYLSEAFVCKGCHVTVLTTAEQAERKNNHGIEIISLGKHSSFAVYQLVHFDELCRKWIAANPQDIVFGMERTRRQDVYRAGSGVHKIYLERRKKIEGFLKNISFTLNPLHHVLCNYEKAAFEDRELQLLFTNSEMVKEEICMHFTTDPQKIHVVHNGVEYHRYEHSFLQRSFSLKGPYHFLFVGNGYLRKGLGLLLPALAQLKEKDWVLSVVGKEKNIPYFQSIAKQLGILDRVHFYGPQREMVSFYQKADALVIPSLYDPFANVTLEALCFGLFIVTSRYNGAAEILTPMMGNVIEDLFDMGSMKASLQSAFLIPRDKQSCAQRREAIRALDFSHQLDLIVSKTLTLST